MTADANVFTLPDLGEGLTEAEIVRWRVAVGDTIAVDDIVVEVETAKAIVDVPCPYAGRVVALHGVEGESRPVGQPLVTVTPITVTPIAVTPVAVAPVNVAPRGGVAADGASPAARDGAAAIEASGNVLVGYGTGAGPAARRRRHRLPGAASERPVPTASAAATVPATAVPAPAVPAAAVPATAVRHAPRVISPLVRRIARIAGVDVTAVRGTGPGGLVRRADVRDAIAAGPTIPGLTIPGSTIPGPTIPGPTIAGPAIAGPAIAGPAGTATEVVAGEARSVGSGPNAEADEVVIALRGARRTIAEKLSRSRREIPEVTVWVDVDATALLETRAAINVAHPDRPIGVLALLARICVSALRRFPVLNSRVDLAGERIVQSNRIHLGVATSTDRGLMVPVIADADRLTTLELAARLATVTSAARAGTLPPSGLTGGTFTLNNYGVFGVDGSTPIINHPEAALLGVGRIVDKPWVVAGGLAVRKVGQLSLTFDHRVCDGEIAGGFLRHVADCVERPALLIANL